jgi:hypothetical protein
MFVKQDSSGDAWHTPISATFLKQENGSPASFHEAEKPSLHIIYFL